MTAPTLAERLTRRAAAIIAPTKDKPVDPGGLAKAEAHLQACRDTEQVARKALHAALEAAAATGTVTAHQDQRRALDAATATVRDALTVHEIAQRNHVAGVSFAEQARMVAAVEKLLAPLYINGTALDSWLDVGGKLIADRRRLHDELIKAVPDGRYGALSVIANSDFLLQEQFAAHKIPGGVFTLRDASNRRSCAEQARTIASAAMAAAKPKPKAPGS